MGSAGHAHLSAGRPGLHMPKLRHLEAVHGGWDRASAGLRTRGVRSQVNDEKPPWTLAACRLSSLQLDDTPLYDDNQSETPAARTNTHRRLHHSLCPGIPQSVCQEQALS